MVAIEFASQPNSLKIFSRGRNGSRNALKQNDKFAFEGKDRIDFYDEDDVLQFFLPEDFAYMENDTLSAHGRSEVLRYFYTEKGQHFILVGAALSWVKAAPDEGNLVIDPTVESYANQDVWLEDNRNFDGDDAGLLVGNALRKKRTLVQFDLSGTSVPTNATVLSANLRLYYYNRVHVSQPWVDRLVHVNEVLVDWNEAATRDVRGTGTNWSTPYGALDNQEIKSAPESLVLFTIDTPLGSWQSWDLTQLAQKWVETPSANKGVILWADNENTEGYDPSAGSGQACAFTPARGRLVVISRFWRLCGRPSRTRFIF